MLPKLDFVQTKRTSDALDLYPWGSAHVLFHRLTPITSHVSAFAPLQRHVRHPFNKRIRSLPAKWTVVLVCYLASVNVTPTVSSPSPTHVPTGSPTLTPSAPGAVISVCAACSFDLNTLSLLDQEVFEENAHSEMTQRASAPYTWSPTAVPTVLPTAPVCSAETCATYGCSGVSCGTGCVGFACARGE
jgi:hypothetical protein